MTEIDDIRNNADGKDAMSDASNATAIWNITTRF